MSTIAPIASTESGLSARAKINALISLYNAANGANYLAQNGSVQATGLLKYFADYSASADDSSMMPRLYNDGRYAQLIAGGFVPIMDGGNIIFNHASYIINDNTGVSSIDYNNREFRDFSGIAAMNYGRRVGHDSSNNDSIDWENRYLQDIAEHVSIDWALRRLKTSAGITVANWSGPNLVLGADATSGYQAVTYQQLMASIALLLPLNGGTLTGNLTLNADATSALQPVTYQQLTAAVTGVFKIQQGYDPTITSLYPLAVNTNPTVANIKKGFIWSITADGNINGILVKQGDEVVALVDSPAQTNANWNIISHDIGYSPLSNVLNSASLFVGNGSNVAAGVVPTLNATPGSFALSNTGVFTFPDATTSLRGLLNSADWNTFNGKQNALSGTGFVKISGTTISYDNSTYITASSTNTLSNKTLDTSTVYQSNLTAVTINAAPTYTVKNKAILSITALNTAITNMSTNLSGSGNNGDLIMWQITDNGTARAITWGSSYGATTDWALPTTTVINKILRIIFQYNSANSLWECVGVING